MLQGQQVSDGPEHSSVPRSCHDRTQSPSSIQPPGAAPESAPHERYPRALALCHLLRTGLRGTRPKMGRALLPRTPVRSSHSTLTLSGPFTVSRSFYTFSRAWTHTGSCSRATRGDAAGSCFRPILSRAVAATQGRVVRMWLPRTQQHCECKQQAGGLGPDGG